MPYIFIFSHFLEHFQGRNYLQFELFFSLTCPLLFFADALLYGTLYNRVGLRPMYEKKHFCHPAMVDIKDREASFPPDLRFESLGGSYDSVEDRVRFLAKEGHFYSHVRLMREETTCYACGQVNKWWDRHQDLHTAMCSHLSEIDQSRSEDGRETETVQLQPCLIGIDGAISVLLKSASIFLLAYFRSQMVWNYRDWLAGKCRGEF